MNDIKNTSGPPLCYQIAHWWDNRLLPRYIVSAANRYTLKTGEKIIIPSVRHYSPEHGKILDVIEDSIVSTHVYGDDQGFVDQFSNYWTREEALVIATHAGQIGVRREKTFPGDTLFSEDLY